MDWSCVAHAFRSSGPAPCAARGPAPHPCSIYPPLQNVATLLVAGLLVRPQTAKPAPLLALAMEEEHKRKQQQQQPREGGGAAAAPAEVAAASTGPAAAVLRCWEVGDVEAALGLHGRRVYCPPAVPGGPFSWQPLTVRSGWWRLGGWLPGLKPERLVDSVAFYERQ